MEKKIEKTCANIGASVVAAQAVNENKNMELKDSKSNNYGVTLNGELKDPEITGTDNLELSIEGPFGIKLNLKATSQVTSSVAAQEALNEQARKNLEVISNFLGKVALAVAPTLQGISNTVREEKDKDTEAYIARRKKEQAFDIEIEKQKRAHRHEMEMEDVKNNHERRMLEKELNDEYGASFGNKDNE